MRCGHPIAHERAGSSQEVASSFAAPVKAAGCRSIQHATSSQRALSYVTITGQAGQGKSSVIAQLVAEYGSFLSSPDPTTRWGYCVT